MIIEVGYKDEKTTVLYQKYAIHPSKLQEFINALIEAKMFYKEEIEEALPEVPMEEEELPPPPKPKKPSKKTKKVKPKKKENKRVEIKVDTKAGEVDLLDL